MNFLIQQRKTLKYFQVQLFVRISIARLPQNYQFPEPCPAALSHLKDIYALIL